MSFTVAGAVAETGALEPIQVGVGIPFPTGPTIEINPVLVAAMRSIARGRKNGRPHAGFDAQQIMRKALADCGMEW